MKKKLVSGQKLAPQFRTATLSVDQATLDGLKRDGAEADARVVKNVSVSSDEPYERWYGTEILAHTSGAIDLSRVKTGASPLLYNHDRDQLLGKISNPRLSDGKLYVDMKFSTSEAGAQALSDLKDGILTECSIGYDINKMEVDEDEEEYTATRWTLYEVSLVTIPADFTVGVGRATESDGVEVEIEIKSKKPVDGIETGSKTTSPSDRLTDQPQDMKRKHFLEADKGDNATTGTLDAAATTRLKTEARDEERKRVADIQDLSEHFRKKGLAGRKIDTAEFANQCIKEGKTLREFQDGVMTGTFKAIETETVVTEDDDPHAERDDNGGSGIRVVGDRPSAPARQRMSVGAEFVNSKQFKAAASARGQGGRNASIQIKDAMMLGARGKSSLAQRAGFASADLASINIQVLPGMVELGMQRLTVMDLLTGGATDAAALPYAKENSFGTINGQAFAAGTYPRAQTVGEGGAKPVWAPDLTTDIANVKKVAVVTKVPDEFMNDFAGMRSYIDNRLPYMVDLETEFQLLYGTGTGNDLKGIYTSQGVQARAIDTTSDTSVAASLKKGLTDVSVYSQFEPTGYVMHPFDWETASLLKDTNGRFLAGGPFYIPYGNGVFVEMNTFWGKPVVVTTSCTYGKPLCGAWKLGAQYFVREGMRLETTNSNRDDFENNLIAIRAEHRLALATYRPIAFLEFTGMPART